MDWYFISAQIVGAVAAIFTIISLFQNVRYRTMLLLTGANVALATAYFLLGRILGGTLVAVSAAKTLVFFFYTMNNKRPNFKIVLAIEAIFIGLAIFLWQDVVDMFIILDCVIVTITSWQSDIFVLRVGYLVSALLLITFDIFVRGYSLIASEVCSTIPILIMLIRYSYAGRIDNLVEKYYESMRDIFDMHVEENARYNLVYSNKTDDMNYNFAVKNDSVDILETIKDIRKDMGEHSLRPLIYLPFNAKTNDNYIDLAETMNMYYKTAYHDVWMKLLTGYNLNNTKCKLKNMEFRKVDSTCADEVVKVFTNGFLSTTTPTPDQQKMIDIVEHFLKNPKNTDNFVENTYLAYYYGVPVSMLMVVSDKQRGFICKVGTVPKYRRKHIASNLIQFAVDCERKNGVQDFYLCTEKYSAAEKFYAYNSFIEIMQGYCLELDVSTDESEFESLISKKDTIESAANKKVVN